MDSIFIKVMVVVFVLAYGYWLIWSHEQHKTDVKRLLSEHDQRRLKEFEESDNQWLFWLAVLVAALFFFAMVSGV